MIVANIIVSLLPMDVAVFLFLSVAAIVWLLSFRQLFVVVVVIVVNVVLFIICRKYLYDCLYSSRSY